jgi:hypothetical protein
MKKLRSLSIICVIFSIISCNENIYKRPITINKVVFINEAGLEYQEKLDTINAWYLQFLDSIQISNQGMVIDTSIDKKESPMNYYVETTLDKRKSGANNQLIYSIYIHPNKNKVEEASSDIEYDYLFAELGLISNNDSTFFNNKLYIFQYLSGIGVASKLMPSSKLYEPLASSLTALKSFSVDSIKFSSGFNRSQKNFFKNIINNSFVLRQADYPSYSMLNKKSFAFHPNFLSKSSYIPGEYTMNLNVIDNEATNEIYIKMNYHGNDVNFLVPDRLSDTIVINRQEFFAGNHYEANIKISRLVSNFIAMQYFFDK